MSDIKILYKGIWTAFQRQEEIDTSYIRILTHNSPYEMDIYGMDSMHGYIGVQRGKLIAAAPEMYNLLSKLCEVDADDFATVDNWIHKMQIQKEAKELLEKIDYKGGSVI